MTASALFVDVAAILEAHELHPQWSKATGTNVWACRAKECNGFAVPSTERAAPAQAKHQAEMLAAASAGDCAQ